MRRTLGIIFTAFVLSFPMTALAKDITLDNGKVKMTFAADGTEFCFKSFEMQGRQLIADGGTKAFPWTMTLLGTNGESPAMTPRWCQYAGGLMSADGRSATFTWKMLLEGEWKYSVSMHVSLPEDADLPEWSISAELPAGWVVTDLEFPRISVARPDNVKGIMAVGYGAEYNIGTSGMIQSKYPSGAGTMQLIMAYNPEGTWFFSPKDKGASTKFIQIRAEGSELCFVQQLVASYGWTCPCGHFSLPWATVMGYHTGYWDKAVLDWYRPFTFETQWGAKTLAEREIVPWIKDADVWMRPGNVTPETMDGVRKSIELFGNGLGLHWYYWHAHPFDTFYPEYFPAQNGFKEMIAEAQVLGAHVTPYTNGRLWDPATESYRNRGGYDASCRKRDGSLYTEIYSSKVVNTVTCPASDIWQQVQREVDSLILYDLGTDGVYIDQIGCAISQPCYATNHGHAPGDGDWWPAAYRKLLTGMKADIYGPDKAVTTEECAECYIDLFDMMLVVNGPHSPWAKMVPLFPLVYSDRCIYSGYTYIPWKMNNGSFLLITAKSLLWGSQLGWADPKLLLAPGCEREVKFLQTLGEFRKAQHDLFLGGRFQGEFFPEGDNPQVDVPGYFLTPVVMGSVWESVDGTEATILVNMSEEDHRVKLPYGSEITVKALSAIRINQ